MHLTWKRMDGRYEIGLHGRNLTNEEYITSGLCLCHAGWQLPPLWGLRVCSTRSTGAPRTITLTGQINF